MVFYIWVASFSSNYVTKILASNATIAAVLQAGTAPWGLAFDGKNMWMTNSSTGSLYRLK
jgi:DNA-binding beta-propeller fold protein YncE